MRKITRDACNAFKNAQKFKRGNTEVEVKPNVTVFKLFGHSIAYLYNDPKRTLSITNCGYDTVTTKDRLNGILQSLDTNKGIEQKNYEWFINSYEYNPFKIVDRKKWDGGLIDIETTF